MSHTSQRRFRGMCTLHHLGMMNDGARTGLLWGLNLRRCVVAYMWILLRVLALYIQRFTKQHKYSVQVSYTFLQRKLCAVIFQKKIFIVACTQWMPASNREAEALYSAVTHDDRHSLKLGISRCCKCTIEGPSQKEGMNYKWDRKNWNFVKGCHIDICNYFSPNNIHC
jgi:hypothetical protein